MTTVTTPVLKNLPGIADQQRKILNISAALIPFVGILVYLAISIFWYMRGFSTLQGDVGLYVLWSQNITEPGNLITWWVPGYPWLIWAMRWCTFGVISDLILTKSIMLFCWFTGVYLIFQLCQKLAPLTANFGTWLYALFPFVGITIVAFPFSDNAAISLVLGGMYFLLCIERRFWFICCCATAIMMHKVTWPYVCILSLWAWWHGKLKWWHVIVIYVPLCLYYVAVSAILRDLFWPFRFHMEHAFKSESHLPLFDGLIGTFLAGGSQNILKASILISLFIVHILTAAWLLMNSHKNRVYLLMFLWLLPSIAFGVVLNQYEVWAFVRFAKLSLPLPLAIVLSNYPFLAGCARNRALVGTLVVGLIVTNFAWASYLLSFYSS